MSEYTARYSDEDGEDVEIESTTKFLEEYIDDMPIDHVKDEERNKVKKLLQIIYDEAIEGIDA